MTDMEPHVLLPVALRSQPPRARRHPPAAGFDLSGEEDDLWLEGLSALLDDEALDEPSPPWGGQGYGFVDDGALSICGDGLEAVRVGEA
jgi:hypothetical protein